jgi:hypothetical protein
MVFLDSIDTVAAARRSGKPTCPETLSLPAPPSLRVDESHALVMEVRRAIR